MAESTTTQVRFEPLPRSCFVAVSSVADCAEVAHVCVGDALLVGGSAAVRPHVLLEVVKRARVASVRTPRCRQKRAAGWPARRAPRNTILIGARRARVGVIFCEGNRGQKMWYQ